MSAFLVENQIINKILTQLDTRIRESEWFKEKVEVELDVDFEDADWETKLGQRMLDLNQLSLSQRYGDTKKELIYKFRTAHCSPIQAYKALRCWLYQCAEGDIPETSKLFNTFDKVLGPAWAEFIIAKTPEYDEAAWG
jgi:hypothetical protein